MSSTISEKDFPVLGGGGGAKQGAANVTSSSDVRTANWKNTLFTRIDREDSSTRKLHFHQPQSINGKRISVIPASDFTDEIRSCENTLVGYFVGRRTSFEFVEKELKKIWKLKGKFRMTLNGESIFIIEFDLEEDKVLAMEIGSVFISSRLFVIRPWHLFIEHSVQEMKTIPIWLNLYNIPSHLWNVKGISRIASVLGIPLLADKHTIERTRMCFARVCVEIDMDFDYPDLIPVSFDGREFQVPVEYSWKPPRCLSCLTFGHLNGKCPDASASKAFKKTLAPKVKKAVEGDVGKPLQVEKDTRLQILELDRVDIGDGAVANSTLPTTNTEVAGSASASIALPNEDKSGDDGVLELVSPNSANKWYTRKSKNSGTKGGRPNDVPICLLNPFNILESQTDGGDATMSENLSNISEDARHETCNPQEQGIETPEVDTGEDSNEKSENETDNDVVDVARVKSVEEVSRWKPMTKEQNMEKLKMFSSSLGVTHGGNEVAVNKILGGIVDTYHSSKPIKDLGPSNDDLGRGKRTPIPKKKV